MHGSRDFHQESINYHIPFDIIKPMINQTPLLLKEIPDKHFQIEK